MKITKEQLKQIIKEELEEMMDEPKESSGMVFPKFKGLEDIATELEAAYNSGMAGSLETAPNFLALADYISNCHKMEDYANMLQFREGELGDLNPDKNRRELLKIPMWVDRFYKTIS